MEIEIRQLYPEEVPFPSSKQLNTESSYYYEMNTPVSIFS